MTTRAQRVIELFNERKVTMTDLLDEIKTTIRNNVKPSTDKEFTQAVIAEIRRLHKVSKHTLKDFYRAMYNEVVRAAQAGKYLALREDLVVEWYA